MLARDGMVVIKVIAIHAGSKISSARVPRENRLGVWLGSGHRKASSAEGLVG